MLPVHTFASIAEEILHTPPPEYLDVLDAKEGSGMSTSEQNRDYCFDTNSPLDGMETSAARVQYRLQRLRLTGLAAITDIVVQAIIQYRGVFDVTLYTFWRVRGRKESHHLRSLQ